MDKERFELLFWKYTAGELNQLEKDEFFRLLDHPAYAALLQELSQKLWQEIPDDPASDSQGNERVKRIVEQVIPVKKVRFRYWTGAAAAMLLGFMFFWFEQDRKQVPEKVVWHTIQVPRGHKRKVDMPDGTSIYLNAGSSMRYSDRFNEGERTVYLLGEAYFDVAAHAKLPFRVKSGSLEVKVLGTSFNVYAFEEDSVCTVDVLTGSVGVRGNILQAGQRLLYTKTSGLSQLTSIAKPEMISAWKTGKLILAGQGFAETARILERWYDVQIHFDPASVKDCHFVGKFDQLPLKEVLTLLRKSSPFSYRIVGKEVYINETR